MIGEIVIRFFKRFALALMNLPFLLLVALDRFVGRMRPDFTGRVRGEAVEKLMSFKEVARHRDIRLEIAAPNALTAYRARSLSEKEPETLEWIDSFDDPQVLWDIGANVGMYSLYAAKRFPQLQVYAFEPSVLNLEMLARNIDANGLTERITIVPSPLFSRSGRDVFRLQGLQRGGAHSAFSVDYGQDNKPLEIDLAYSTIGFSIDDLTKNLGIPVPDHVKLDVDGVEHLILGGGAESLTNPKVQSVLVELNEEFDDQKRTAAKLLQNYGFKLIAKKRAEMFEGTNSESPWNNIWARPA